MNELHYKVINWMANGQVGTSSKTMACVAAGIDFRSKSHPHDPDDFNRCLLLISAIPEIKEHFQQISKVSSHWAALILNWDNVENSFLTEVGLNWCKAKSAPNTYNLMQDIYSNCS